MAFSLKIALANALLAIAAVVWLAALARGSVRRPRAVILVPIAAYAVVSILSALFSLDPRHSIFELADLLTLVIVPMTVSLFDRPRWSRLMTLLALVLAASAIVGIVQYAAGGDPLQHRIRGFATHYMTYSGWTLVVTLLLLGEVFFARRRRRVLWLLPAAALGVSTLLLGLTRGAWIGLLTGLVLALAAGRPRALILLPLVASLLILVIPQPVVSRAVSTIDLRQSATRERLQMFGSGIEMFLTRPVLGVGPGMVQPTYSDHRTEDAPPRIPHLHNNAIQLAAERGLFGLFCYLGVLVVFAIHVMWSWRSGSAVDRPAIIGCAMAVVGVTAAGFFEYNWGDAEVWIVTLVSLSVPFALVPKAPG